MVSTAKTENQIHGMVVAMRNFAAHAWGQNLEQAEWLVLYLVSGASYASENKEKYGNKHLDAFAQDVATKAAKEIVAHFLEKTCQDHKALKWAASLYGKTCPKTGASLEMTERGGMNYWQVIHPGPWGQGGFRDQYEIELGFPFLTLPEGKDLEMLTELASGKNKYLKGYNRN